MSLVDCLKKLGSKVHEDDNAALVTYSAEYQKTDGLAPADANIKAAIRIRDELLEERQGVASEIEAGGGVAPVRPEDVKPEPKPEPEPEPEPTPEPEPEVEKVSVTLEDIDERLQAETELLQIAKGMTHEELTDLLTSIGNSWDAYSDLQEKDRSWWKDVAGRYINRNFGTTNPKWSISVTQNGVHKAAVATDAVIDTVDKGLEKYRDTLAEALLNQVQMQRSQATDPEITAAFDQLLEAGELKADIFTEAYYATAFSAAQKTKKKAETANQKAEWLKLSEDTLTDNLNELNDWAEDDRLAYRAGWEHALSGKTASQLPTGTYSSKTQVPALKKGYDEAKTFMVNKGTLGKQSGKKMEGFGPRLRRLQDLKWLGRDDADKAIETGLSSIWNRVTRAESFPMLMADDATPGTIRVMEEIRKVVMTAKEYIFARLAGGGGLSRGVTEGQAIRAWVYIDKWMNYRFSNPENSLKDGWEDRLEQVREQAMAYMTLTDKVSLKFAGVKTVSEALTIFGDIDNTGYPFIRLHSVTKIWLDRQFGGNRESNPINKKTVAKPLKRPRFDRIDRTELKDYRGGRNVTLKELKETFNFLGVNKGNWVTSKQLQDHSNYAYDSFMDIATHFGWKPSQIGFGGTLHLSFGATGSGRHAAHYGDAHPLTDDNGNLTGESVQSINLTNTSGDGSLWHEYSHALDFALGRTSKAGSRPADYVRMMVDQFKRKPTLTKENIEKRVDQFLYGDWSYRGSRRDKVGNANRVLDQIEKELKHMAKTGIISREMSVGTKYYRNAVELGADYWGNDKELFARASEAWGYDTLAGKNTYLVTDWVADGETGKDSGYRGTPYPMGDERKRFNALFTDMLKFITFNKDGMPTVKLDPKESFLAKEAVALQSAVDEVRDSLPDTNAALAANIKAREDAVQAEKDAGARVKAEDEAAAIRDELSTNVPAGHPGEVKDLDGESIEDIFDEAEAELSEANQELTDADVDSVSPDQKLINYLVGQGFGPGTSLDWRKLFVTADIAYKGTQAEGTYTSKDAYDALEIAINTWLLKRSLTPSEDITAGQRTVDYLQDVTGRLPTMSKRTEEMQQYQQFSTPPTLSYLIARVSGVGPTDIVMEPSAGTGSLVSMAMQAGATSFILNELSARRAKLLSHFMNQKVYQENAEHINDILPEGEKPTVVLMNPPFSSSAGRLSQNDTKIATQHLQQALLRLEDGGRLVALVGKGMAMDKAKFSGFWETVKAEYNVRANVGLSGKIFQKYGTTFDNQLLIIDKTGNTTGAILTDNVDSINDAMVALEDIKNDRTYPGEQFAKQSGGQVIAGRGARLGEPLPVATGQTGPARGGVGTAVGVGASDTPTGKPETGSDTEDTGERGRVAAGESDEGTGRGGRTEPDRGGGRQLSDIAADAASHGVKGIDESLKGLAELFGGSNIKSFPAGFDNEAYTKAKPHFEAAWLEFKAAGKSLKEFFKFLIKNFGAGIKPYAMQFANEKVEIGDTLDAVTQPVLQDLPTDDLVRPVREGQIEALTDDIFDAYTPSVTLSGAQPHPGTLVESAAMAAIQAPETSYVPTISQKIIDSGALSDAQLELVIRAGHAHDQLLPDGRYRKGFFNGDGTGVGKAREAIGVILDNMGKGRKRHLWISDNADQLLDQAKKDWEAVTGKSSKDVFQKLAGNANNKITKPDGIIFASYHILLQQAKDHSGKRSIDAAGNEKWSGGAVRSRVAQLIDWMGPDWDGTIIFDESHAMGKAVSMKGKRGHTGVSKTAIAGSNLQQGVPNARVLYVSATGATEVSNFGYAERLGLWGEGTDFANKEDFVTSIAAKGVSAMEIVAQDLKRLGVYMARSLSYHDVTQRPGGLVHELSTEQVEMYNLVADGWAVIHANVNQALEFIGGIDPETGKAKGSAKGVAMGQLWGAHQRFFKQILYSMQMPSVIEDADKELAKGHAVVFQIVETGNAQMQQALTKAVQQGLTNDELDLTPRQTLLQFLNNAFPVNLQEEVSVPGSDKTTMEVVTDSEGKPVQSADALKLRDEMLEKVALLPIPDGALDIIINHFGQDRVAEATGRSHRMVFKTPRDETSGKKKESWGKNNKIADANAFQDDRKQILVFSRAGGTGVDYHADRNRKNQRKRIHYLVQPGWEANKAMQGFGRTHRSNQKQAPEYVLVSTNIQGHKRFISSIARRLDQLGALTKGQRETGSQGLISAEFNLETKYATEALGALVREAANQKDSADITLNTFQRLMGIQILDDEGNFSEKNMPDIPKFLNRILTLHVDKQDEVFGVFFNRLQETIDYHKEMGDFDVGIENIVGTHVIKKYDQTVYRHAATGAETRHIRLDVESPRIRMTFEQFLDLAQSTDKLKDAVFAVNERSDKFAVFLPTVDKTTKAGAVVKQLRRYDPSGSSPVEEKRILNRRYSGELYTGSKLMVGNWKQIDMKKGAEAWTKAYEETPAVKNIEENLLIGTVLPIWKRIVGGSEHPVRVSRAQTDEGERMIGLRLHESEIDAVLEKLGAEKRASQHTPGDLIKLVMKKGKTLILSNNWRITKRVVSGDKRMELILPSYEKSKWAPALKDRGLFTELINHDIRFFIPTKNMDAFKATIKADPVNKIEGEADGMAARFDLAGGVTIETAESYLKERLGRKAYKGLIASGKFKIVDTMRSLPAGAKGGPADIAGWYDKGTDTTYLVGNRLSTDEGAMNNVYSVLLHEVGVHYGMEKMLGGKWAQTKANVEAALVLSKRGVGGKLNDAVASAAEHVPANTKPEHYAEEVIAYMVQERANEKLPLIKRIFAAIRKFLYQLGITKQVDPDALVLMARDAIRRVSRETMAYTPEISTQPGLASSADQTRTQAFKDWFDDSKVVDDNGDPLVVYHGTGQDFSEFSIEDGESNYGGAQNILGHSFIANTDLAGLYANLSGTDDFGNFVEGSIQLPNIMPTYLSLKNPKQESSVLQDEIESNWTIEMAEDYVGRLKIEGHDGIIFQDKDRGIKEYVVFKPTQIKSAIGNRGTFDANEPNILYSAIPSLHDPEAVANAASLSVGKLLQSDRTFNRWWHKTVGTQFHKATVNKYFKAVFDKGQDYLNAISKYSMQAEAEAPDILQRMEGFSDIFSFGAASKKDMEAIAAPLFEGTLAGENASPETGRVWTDEQLVKRYKLTDKQIRYYRQSLASVAESVRNLAKSTIVKHAENVEIEVDMDMGLADIVETLRQSIDQRVEDFNVELGLMQDETTWRAALADYADSVDNNGILIARYTDDHNRAIRDTKAKMDVLMKTLSDITAIEKKAETLIKAGYFPLQRFGDYTVYMTGKNPMTDETEEQFFGTYDTQAKANRAAAALRDEFPENDVTKGILSKEAYRMFKGLSPESMVIFAEHLDVGKDEALQEFLRLAVSNRSALKRLMHRKGMAGYSRDVLRTMATFITSNSRMAAANNHLGKMQKAIDAIPTNQGDTRDEAERLMGYLTDPKEEVGALRGFLFFNFLGGSVAAAMVNMTQPITMTFPYLAKFVNPAVAGAILSKASMEAATGQPAKDVKAIYNKALEEGIIAPHEIHQLMAQTRGAKGSGVTLHRFTKAWGGFFAMAEAFNRRTTFIAAYRIGIKHRKMNEKQAYDFAVTAVYDTQGIYNKGNRPNWARGSVGATIFTFKQFSIAYIEFLKRLPIQQRIIALLVLTIAAGMQGWPFEEDAMDIIDTIGQWMGYPTNSKKAMREFVIKHAGKDVGGWIMDGVSHSIPLSVSLRLGVHNLIPGTSLLKKSSRDRSREVAEVLGPAAGLALNYSKGLDLIAKGNVYRGTRMFVPLAVRNFMDMIEMWESGQYRNTKGHLTQDVTPTDAVIKGIGFHPTRIAKESIVMSELYDDRAIRDHTEVTIADKWARGIFEHKPLLIKEAREQWNEWNRRAPAGMKIAINFERQILTRVTGLRKDRKTRTLKYLPPEMRAEAARKFKEVKYDL